MIQTSTDKPFDYNTALELVFYRKNSDVDPKSIIITLSCCKAFRSFSPTGDLKDAFWEKQVTPFYQTFLDEEQSKVKIVWKNLFCTYSNEFKNITDECLLIVKEKVSDTEKSLSAHYSILKLYPLLMQHIRNLPLLNSNKVTQYCLGIFYTYGWGVYADQTLALKCFKLSADQGFAQAQYQVALDYDSSLTPLENNEQSLKYLQLAASQNHVPAKNALVDLQSQFGAVLK